MQVMDDAKDSVTTLAVCAHEILSGSADGRMRRYDVRMGQLTCDYIGSTLQRCCVVCAALYDTCKHLFNAHASCICCRINHQCEFHSR